MPRILIRNYHRDTSEEDLKVLFGKIGDVEEIYLPKPTVTGIVRNFAVVKLNSSDESIQRYTKALNGSLWNGSRISIEMAKEYYRDRLNKELAEREMLKTDESSIRNTSITYAEWKSPFVSLRVKANAPCVKISTVPGAALEKGVIPCGWRGFDAKPKKARKSNEERLPQESAVATNTASSVPSSSAAKPAVTSTSSKNIEGGGLRKGFGSIALPTVSTAASSAKTPVVPTKGDIGASVNCCIEEHDNTVEEDEIDSRYLEDEYSEPCITAAELTEEVLKGERMRAMKVLDMLLGVESSATAADSNHGRSDASSSDQASVKASSTAAVAGKTKTSDGWNSAVIKRFDPLKMSQSSNIVPPEPIKPVSNDSAVGDVIGNSQSNYAEMNVLKDIFYKEGGVGWNESHTDIVERTTTGHASNSSDSLFLEAEKFGIDVRTTGTKDNDRMTFNFFESEEPATAAAPSVTSALVTENGNAEMSDEDDTGNAEDGDTICVDPSAARAVLGKRKQLLPPLSLDEVIALGNKFCRVSSVEVIKKQWEEQREKLVEDYKKKTREAKKKGMSKITSSEETSSGGAVKVKRSGVKDMKKSYSGGKARGGVKHAKKNK